jgi:hypothetical protein
MQVSVCRVFQNAGIEVPFLTVISGMKPPEEDDGQGMTEKGIRLSTPRGRFELPRRKAPVAFEATAFPD